jgi:hypothetical protein
MADIAKRVLGLWCLIVFPLLAQDAGKLLEESVRLFAGSNVRFDVEAVVEKPDGKSERSFTVARYEGNGKRALLIRFIAPATLKCTAILTLKDDGKTRTYVYFPSIKRVRIIPRSKENTEAVGLGISYDQLHDSGGHFLPLERFVERNREYFKVTRLYDDGRKSVYIIEADSKRLMRIKMYDKKKLVKEIVVDSIGEAGGRLMVLAWHVIDRAKKRVIYFRVKPSSVSDDVREQWFRKNLLRRCRW